MISDSNQNKKPLIFYMAVAVIVIMLLNAFVFPMLCSGSRLQRFSENGGFKTGIRSIHG